MKTSKQEFESLELNDGELENVSGAWCKSYFATKYCEKCQKETSTFFTLSDHSTSYTCMECNSTTKQ